MARHRNRAKMNIPLHQQVGLVIGRKVTFSADHVTELMAPLRMRRNLITADKGNVAGLKKVDPSEPAGVTALVALVQHIKLKSSTTCRHRITSLF